jgi:hypothetical protein
MSKSTTPRDVVTTSKPMTGEQAVNRQADVARTQQNWQTQIQNQARQPATRKGDR